MKGALIGLATGIALLMLLILSMDVVRHEEGTVDFHLFDTYYVTTYAGLAIVVALLLGAFTSLGGLLGSRLRSRFFALTSLFFLAAGVYWFKDFI